MAAAEAWSASPRFSFSEDVVLVAGSGGDGQRRDGALPVDAEAVAVSGDFNFSISFQTAVNDSSDADELFSDGKIKILPFFKTPVTVGKNPGPAAPPPILNQRGSPSESAARSGDIDAKAASCRRGSGRQSVWRFGRSSSVGSVPPPGSILPIPLHRSRSAGSSPPPPRRPGQPAANTAWNGKPAADSSQRKTYYYSGSQRGSHRGGVRITPVLNVPAPIISRSGSSSSGSSAAVSSLFSYLLCSCGGQQRRDDSEAIRLQFTGAGRTA